MTKISKIIDRKRINRAIKDILIKFKLQNGNLNYCSFIILSDYRSGSNYLMNLLKSHPNIVCYSELFYGTEIYWASAIYAPLKNKNKLLALREKTPLIFLNKYCYRKYHKTIKGVGFKLMYHDVLSKENISLINLLKEKTNLKVIHLQRKNQFERIISVKMLAKTGQAVAINEEKWSLNDHQVNSIIIDKEYCEKEFNYRRNMRLKLEQMVQESGNKNLTIYYEDLNFDKEKTINKTIDFLGLSQLKLATNQVKQNKKSMNDRVKNYSELKEYFKQTEWSTYFTE